MSQPTRNVLANCTCFCSSSTMNSSLRIYHHHVHHGEGGRFSQVRRAFMYGWLLSRKRLLFTCICVKTYIEICGTEKAPETTSSQVGRAPRRLELFVCRNLACKKPGEQYVPYCRLVDFELRGHIFASGTHHPPRAQHLATFRMHPFRQQSQPNANTRLITMLRLPTYEPHFIIFCSRAQQRALRLLSCQLAASV